MKTNIIVTDLHVDDKLSRYLTKHNTFVSIIKLCFFLLKKKIFSLILRRKPSSSDNKQHVVFELAGGLGDFFIHAKYISFFYKRFGDDLIIDLITDPQHLETIKLIFDGFSCINTIHDKKRKYTYDLYIRLVRFPEIRYYFPHRLSEQLNCWASNILHFFKKNRLLLQNDFLGRCYSEICGKSRETQADIGDFLHLEANDDFGISLNINPQNTLTKFNLETAKFILLQTGPGIAFKGYSDVRQWPKSYYHNLVKLIKKNHSDIKLVQIGHEYQNLIPDVDLDLRGKTSLEELFTLLDTAKLLISQEGGCVIARHFISKKPSCVLFGPTNKNFFGFSENLNIAANVCPGCEWVVRNWVDKCIRGRTEPECMHSITPEYVFERLQNRGIL